MISCFRVVKCLAKCATKMRRPMQYILGWVVRGISYLLWIAESGYRLCSQMLSRKDKSYFGLVNVGQQEKCGCAAVLSV